MDFFAIISAVLQLSNCNFRQFAAPSQVPPGAARTSRTPLATPLLVNRLLIYLPVKDYN